MTMNIEELTGLLKIITPAINQQIHDTVQPLNDRIEHLEGEISSMRMAAAFNKKLNQT